jgi:uncharacterized RDD family membrane protein YckC
MIGTSQRACPQTSSVDREQVRIAGLTGIDLTLDIAGPGSRSYAYIIDWHIRLLLGLAWFLAVSLSLLALGHSLPSLRTLSRQFAMLTFLPALGIYVLYHPLLEIIMRGRTPGKRIAGVRIVTRNGGSPGVAALLIRNVLRLLDALPAFYLIGLICCCVTAQRVRIGDLVAGTLLVIDARGAADSLARVGTLVAHSGLAPSVVELIHDLLERWQELTPQKRAALAATLLAHVDASCSAAALAALSDAQLMQRLRMLLEQDRAGSP